MMSRCASVASKTINSDVNATNQNTQQHIITSLNEAVANRDNNGCSKQPHPS